MKVHYFQRYQKKENVVTANTMLFLSHIYNYSPELFFSIFRVNEQFSSFDPEIKIRLQEKITGDQNSIPDAVISQESFKIVVETKTTGRFNFEQLNNHLKSFSDEKYSFLISISPKPMLLNIKNNFEKELKKYNCTHNKHIAHFNTTFDDLITNVQEVINENDYKIKEILDDYIDYCRESKLLKLSDKFMRVRSSNITYDFDMKYNVYFDNAKHGFRSHDYLGLYKDKKVCAIGKINAQILAVENKDGQMEYSEEIGHITDKIKDTINLAIKDAERRGDDLRTVQHRYFFVEKFIETNFIKTTPRALWGSRIFDLSQLLGVDKIPETEEVAKLLSEKTW